MPRTPVNASRARPDVAVVGGGVIGCSLAHRLAVSGATVTLLERSRPGHEATRAAAGMLSPLSEGLEPDAFLRLGVESLRRYPSFLEEISESSGRAVRIVESGKIQVAFDVDEAESLEAEGERLRNSGFSARWLAPSDARAIEPALTSAVRGGLLFEDEAQVDNRLLGKAVPEAARSVGVRIETGARVHSVVGSRGRVTGVEREDGSLISAGAVVVAAGAWSGGLGGLPRPLPVHPVRGQMLGYAEASGLLSTIVESPGIYLVPRDGGPLLVGSTMEDAGFDRRPTQQGIRRLRSGAEEAAPDVAGMRPSETWAGLRPGTPDGLPILGEDPEMAGLFYATGHFRNGILLAPITAEVVSRLVLDEEAGSLDLAPFRPDRFSEAALIGRRPPERDDTEAHSGGTGRRTSTATSSGPAGGADATS